MFWNKKIEPAMPVSADFEIARMSYLDLKELRERIDAQMAEQFEQAQTAFREDFLAKMDAFGLTIDDLKPRKKKRGPQKGAVKPRYVHPDDATKVWSGRGLPPSWLKDLIADGKAKEDFLIDRQNGPADSDLGATT